jgi:hypothetical protein
MGNLSGSGDVWSMALIVPAFWPACFISYSNALDEIAPGLFEYEIS